MEKNELGTVLVVGGSGFLGAHIVAQLLSGTHTRKIVITSRNPKAIDDERVTYEAMDITSKIAVCAVIDKVMPQVIISAASPAPRSSARDLYDTNVIGTKNLLDAAKACPETKAFLYTSSNAACRPSPFKQITEEECILYSADNFKDAYGKTKAIGDQAVLHANSPQLRTAVIRVSLLYGEGDTNFIAQAVASIRKGEHKNQVGTNKKMWEYVYVKSAAHAHVLAAQALLNNVPGAAGQAFFITDDAPMPFFDFMRKCYAAAGHPVSTDELKVIPLWVVQMIASVGEWAYWIFTLGMVAPTMRRADIDHLDDGSWWSIEKSRRVLGYEPVMEQDKAIDKSMKWGMERY